MLPYNGVTLGYSGDAVYEVIVREHFLNTGDTLVDALHKKTILYTCAEGQAKAFERIKDMLTEEEMSVFKRGRNAKTDRKARSASMADYQQATGFEAVIGFLHLTNQKERLMNLCTSVLDK